MVVEAVVHKESPETQLGIGLTDVEGKVYISKISPDGLFANSHLKTGQRVVSIDGSTPLNKNTSIKHLKASSGEIHVLTEDDASIRIINVSKGDTNSVGIGLRNNNGKVVVGTIKEGSIFANTELAPGQRLISINKSSCNGLNQTQVAQLFKSASDELRVVVEQPQEMAKITIRETLPPGSIEVNAAKDKSSIGIGLRTINGSVVVGSVKEDSIFANTELAPGQRILSVNDTNCQGMDHHQVVQLFKAAQETVRVVVLPAVVDKTPKAVVAPKKEEPIVVEPEDTTEYVEHFEVITVHKESADTKLGVGLVNEKDGSVVFSRINRDGVFAGCANLEKGCRLVSINDESCEGLNKNECSQKLKEATGELKICVGIQQKVVSFNELSTILYGVVADESVMMEMGKQVAI